MTSLSLNFRSPSDAVYKRKRPRKSIAGWVGLAVLAAATLSGHSPRSGVRAFVVPEVHNRVLSPVAASSSFASASALAAAFHPDATATSSSSHLAPVRPHRPSVSSLPMTAPRSSDSASSPPPPTDFELGVGRALDTLRRDYPTLLVSHPDYTIYRRDISIVDPSGVHVHGLTAYKNAFRLLHAVVKLVYCIDRSSLNFKMCFDKARHNIRIHWHAIVVPREIFGGIRTTLHVDGISVYELDPTCGNVTEHRIEQLLINDQPVVPEEGLIAALQDRHLQGVGSAIPTFSSVLEFQSLPRLRHFTRHGPPASLLFAWEGMEQSPSGSAAAAQPSSNTNKQHHHQQQQQQAYRQVPSNSQSKAGSTTGSTASSSTSPSQPAAALASADTTAAASASSTAASPVASASSTSAAATLDWTKFEQKNQSRKKFGLKPLTVEEFLDIERQVAELDAQQRQKMAAAAQQSASARDEAAQSPSGPNLWDKIFGTVLKDTCESNFDCDRPEICCDFGFKKMCCASGTPVGSYAPQYAYVPVPVDVGPNEGPGGAGGYYPPY